MKARTLAALAFVVSRLAYRIALGVSFDSSPAHYFLQILDPFYLEHDLARSVLSLHHQAPLFNLAIGLALKCFGREAWVALDLMFIALGLWATVSLADLFERLGLSRAAAATGAALFACSPVTVLYESWLFYSHLVSAVAIIAAAALVRFVAEPRLSRGAVFFGMLAVIGLTRSTFGPLWFLLVVVALLWLAPVPRRLIAKAAAIPLLVLLLHAAKTPLYVGVGYGDAMLWPNLAKKIF
ncbi:MAG: hypothetical protein JNK04_04535, partial [Myxococcales bacterium]|nr:hypothetical protein [Myxococcales bacterium]